MTSGDIFYRKQIDGAISDSVLSRHTHGNVHIAMVTNDHTSMVGNLHDRVIRFTTAPSPCSPMPLSPSRERKVITFRRNHSEEEDRDKYVLLTWPYGEFKTAFFFNSLFISVNQWLEEDIGVENRVFDSAHRALQAVQNDEMHRNSKIPVEETWNMFHNTHISNFVLIFLN